MIRNLSLSVFIIGMSVAVAAQKPTAAPRQYDPSTEQTYQGVIDGVIATQGTDGTVGVHLDVQTTGNRVVRVHLGPAIFIGMNDESFFAGDAVVVTGAFVSHDGETALWARQVTKNGKTLTLRGPDGTPRWPSATADDPDGCGVSHAPVRY